MSDWKETTLADLSTDITYGYTESANSEQIGPKFLRITDIANGRLNWSAVPYCPISDKDYEKYKLFPGDIVVARTGATTGSNYTMKENDPKDVVFASYLIRYKIDRSLADPFYIGQILQSQNWQDYVDAVAGGSAQPGANAKQLGSFDILLPPLPEQKAIAAVLSSLDDKIDLLHRQNKTLEAMAETLFRQWFVEEADEAWEEVPLSFLAENIRENVKVENLSDHEHYVGLEHIPRKRVILDSWGATDSIESNKSTFKKYDILFGKLRSYFHKVVYTPISGVCSTDILVIRAKKEHWQPFCLFWFFSKDVVEHSDLGSGGTRMPRTNWEIVSSYKVPCPPEELIIEFDRIIRPSLNKMFQNINAIRTLEKLRDTLLPKLMSREVRVKV